MPDPAAVGLLIFDTDGTIVASLRAVHESIKRTFAANGWPFTMSQADIVAYFGTAAGELYRAITPPDGGLGWEQVRDAVIGRHEAAFREFGRLYPGVPETLAELRRRGYKLALYSNAGIAYFKIVTSVFGLGAYFDHLECIEENSLPKPQLVRKIADKFGLDAAVVGDRRSDIEAARANGTLAVGARYSYGGAEPEQADIAVDSFGQLLDVFGGQAA